jgi:6,7-dimethyl-8-ribityllumazine synthase
MATTDLSNYDFNKVPNGANFKVGIVVSEWNSKITFGLLKGAEETLLKHGVSKENIEITFVPGAFELALGAQFLFENSDHLDAVICIGTVIRGETAHFDYVCQGATQGIMETGLKYNKPCVFCVLTDDNEQQSIDRSGGKHGNKGVEAGVAALKMIELKKPKKTGSIGF